VGAEKKFKNSIQRISQYGKPPQKTHILKYNKKRGLAKKQSVCVLLTNNCSKNADLQQGELEVLAHPPL
jgi:hypothetical protein